MVRRFRVARPARAQADVEAGLEAAHAREDPGLTSRAVPALKVTWGSVCGTGSSAGANLGVAVGSEGGAIRDAMGYAVVLATGDGAE